MNAAEILKQLTDEYAARDLIQMAKRDAIPPEVQKVLNDIEVEFQEQQALNAERIERLESLAKQAVLEAGETVRGGALQAVWSKGRVSWDTKKLDGLMIVIPELNQARKVGEPSVSIRMVGDSK